MQVNIAQKITPPIALCHHNHSILDRDCLYSLYVYILDSYRMEEIRLDRRTKLSLRIAITGLAMSNME